MSQALSKAKSVGQSTGQQSLRLADISWRSCCTFCVQYSAAGWDYTSIPEHTVHASMELEVPVHQGPLRPIASVSYLKAAKKMSWAAAERARDGLSTGLPVAASAGVLSSAFSKVGHAAKSRKVHFALLRAYFAPGCMCWHCTIHWEAVSTLMHSMSCNCLGC